MAEGVNLDLITNCRVKGIFFLHLKQNQSLSEQMVEAFIFQETKDLSIPFNSPQWEAEASPRGSASTGLTVREANPQLAQFLNFTRIVKNVLFF